MLRDLILKNRSYRRFHQHEMISEETLRELIDLARLSPSAKNMQPLKFMLSCDPKKNSVVFRHLIWAGYLKDWLGPDKDEQPAGYIIILGDTLISKAFGCDHGIAAQSIMLGAVEKGFGGCIIESIKREGLRNDMKIADHLEILLVLALGKPKETVIIENLGEDGDIKYWRDEKEQHHVPKRSLNDLIIH